MFTITPFLRVIWGEWNIFIYLCVCVKCLLPLKMLIFLTEDWPQGSFLPKPHETLSTVKGFCLFVCGCLFCFVIVWFLILERTEAFLFWIYLSFQERTKHFPATITLKSGKVKVSEYLRKLGRGLLSFSSNTSFELMNQWMIVTSRPWRVMKKSFEINANLWLWILQIVETDPDSS